jgi:diguanylate cyclase (GGDEF)-like protein/putative nucleotidyltransferase with HDIG domain
MMQNKQNSSLLLQLYIAFVSTVAGLLYIFNSNLAAQSLDDWVLIYVFSGAILLLNHFLVYLPPKDNTFSMDSAVYLASLFLYGLDLTLNVLLLNNIIFALFKQRIAWWKHLFNFSMYLLMIVTSYCTFIALGGEVGGVNTYNIFSHIISLAVYFVVNTLLISLFFVFTSSSALFNTFKGVLKIGILKESFVGYSVTLLLSLVLTILMKEETFFGLFLFTILVVLLSFVFSKFLYLYQDVAKKANKDYLTGLYNHGFFKEVLEEKIENFDKNGKPLCIALLDLDDFKKYNDSNGHLQGDELLKFFGEFLKSETDGKNFVVARYGGEEFAVLMPNATKKEALSFFDHLRKRLNDTYFPGVENLPYRCLSFSCGIAECENETYDASELIHKADQALYYAKAQGKNNVQIYDEQNIAFDAIQYKEELDALEQLLKIFLSKDVYTYRHSKRVFKYAAEFSERLPLSEHEKQTLILGALIHDIGKLEVPRDIINKEGKLEPHEWEIMKKHVTWGKEIISTDKKFEELIPLVELHHERYDGKGYPYGLKGEEIPKLARILCIIDSFDAMTTERPYQRTKTFAEAIEELRQCAGQQFDPTYVEPFIDFIETNYQSNLHTPCSLAN